jgi:hypothetical protein
MAQWPVPKNVADLVAADPDHVWETDVFAPILLSVIGGTVYSDRPVPLAWQIQFEADDVAGASGEDLIAAAELEPDGDGWCALIVDRAIRQFPEMADQLRTDSEQSTCVLWVESEELCRKLIQVVLTLVSD